MKIDLNKAEMDYVVSLMDIGIKAAGLQAVKPELQSVIEKFSLAIQEASKPPNQTLTNE